MPAYELLHVCVCCLKTKITQKSFSHEKSNAANLSSFHCPYYTNTKTKEKMKNGIESKQQYALNY